MSISFNTLQIGHSYKRPFLAKLWGYKSFHAISRGVVTPSNTKFIIFFVTKDKQEVLTQYNDYIDGDLLFWEGEDGHRSDQRIIDTINSQDEIHLFYRDVHHTPFVYLGIINLVEYQVRKEAPSEFIFQIASIQHDTDVFSEVREYAPEYNILAETEKDAVVKSRIGQGKFRKEMIRIWGSGSVTGLHNITLLRASHMKPWKESTNSERINPYNGLLLIPNYDLLFDKGLITFDLDGKVIISEVLSFREQRVFRVDRKLHLRKVFEQSKEFLSFHNENVFKG